MKRVEIGVFQGSIAGHLLFIIFFNDLVVLEDSVTSISIYADDNNDRISLGDNIRENHEKIDNKIKEGENYMNANKLKFNASKTQLMIMMPSSIKKNSSLKVNIAGNEILPEKNVKLSLRMRRV